MRSLPGHFAAQGTIAAALVHLVTFGEPERKHRAIADPEQVQCPVATGPTMPRSRHPLPDDAAAKVGVDQAAAGSLARLDQRLAADPVLCREPLEPAVHQDAYHSAGDYQVQSESSDLVVGFTCGSASSIIFSMASIMRFEAVSACASSR